MICKAIKLVQINKFTGSISSMLGFILVQRARSVAEKSISPKLVRESLSLERRLRLRLLLITNIFKSERKLFIANGSISLCRGETQ